MKVYIYKKMDLGFLSLETQFETGTDIVKMIRDEDDYINEIQYEKKSFMLSAKGITGSDQKILEDFDKDYKIFIDLE